jgi:DNA-binding SARP family transcriptional activator
MMHAARSNTVLRLRTFGGLSIGRADPSTTSPGATSARRRLAVLAVIAANGPRGIPRDRLLALFWPESDTDRARHSLDQTVYQLKRDLGAAGLFLGRDELSLNPNVITSDVGEFRSALERGDHAHAVELNTGAFLDGVYIAGAPEFEHWVDAERVSLMNALERALETLATEAGQRGDHQAAVQWCQRLMALDPRKTRSVVALMSALATSGDRTAALRYAELYLSLIRDDEDIEPNPQVEALVLQLRKQPAPVVSPIDLSPATGVTPLAPSNGVTPSEGEALADRYVIEREIGRGGSATVFVARDLRNDRPVAVKVLRRELAAGIAVERFRQEITVGANLQHPHILPVLDSGEANGTLFFVMPHVEEASLREQLERAGRIPVEEGVRLATEIASALSYAHGRGIAHRDIKPENVLLSSGHAIVADFGMARVLDARADRQLTRPGSVEGSVAYLSPEQLNGQRGDALSDQYSLAYLLYEILGGEPPFKGKDIHELMAQRLRTEPAPIRSKHPDTPAHVDAAIMRALARDPAARFADVKSFAHALHPQRAASTSEQRNWLRRLLHVLLPHD